MINERKIKRKQKIKAINWKLNNQTRNITTKRLSFEQKLLYYDRKMKGSTL